MIKFFDEWFANLTANVLLVIALYVPMYALYQAINADGKITHCYVDDAQGSAPVYVIIGHRDWRPDAILGIAETGPEAHSKMKELCP